MLSNFAQINSDLKLDKLNTHCKHTRFFSFLVVFFHCPVQRPWSCCLLVLHSSRLHLLFCYTSHIFPESTLLIFIYYPDQCPVSRWLLVFHLLGLHSVFCDTSQLAYLTLVLSFESILSVTLDLYCVYRLTRSDIN